MNFERRVKSQQEWHLKWANREARYSLPSIITLIEDNVLEISTAVVRHESWEENDWRPLSEVPELNEKAIHGKNLKLNKDAVFPPTIPLQKNPEEEVSGENDPPKPLTARDIILSAPSFDEKQYDKRISDARARHHGEKQTEPDQHDPAEAPLDFRDAKSHHKAIRATLQKEKDSRLSQTKLATTLIHIRRFLKVSAVSAMASKVYFLYEGWSHFLLGFAIGVPLLYALRWILRKT